MLFNSITFLLFLPIAFAGYWFVRRAGVRWQNSFILFVSYVFYGWLDWRFCLLLAISGLTAYCCGLLQERAGRAALLTGVSLELGILGFFKYYNFFADSLSVAFASVGLSVDVPTLRILLPVGISFYSFMAISYIVDVSRKTMSPVRDPLLFLSAISFFPQLLAGPIGRMSQMVPQFEKPRDFDSALAADGCRQMLWGYFKKMVIADGCAILTDRIFLGASTLSGSTLLLGAFIYAIQIYADFSGYSDLAIGCGNLFGIRLMRNFSFPYFATNIADFWRRWHISLTTWFRDYVYIPLGGSRCSKSRQILNTIIVFLLSGLWHGASWTFVIWGLVHGLLFVPLILLGLGKKGVRSSPVRTLFAWALTFFAVMLAWIFFRADDIRMAFTYLSGIFSKSLLTLPRSYLSMLPWIFVCIGFEWFQRKREHGLDVAAWPIVLRWVLYIVIAVICLAYKQRDAAFIYFQF